MFQEYLYNFEINFFYIVLETVYSVLLMHLKMLNLLENKFKKSL